MSKSLPAGSINARRGFRGVLADMNGTSAIEFAMVAPVFLALCIGGVYMCMMMWSMGSLQEAVQQASRCWAISSGTCTSASATQTYASTNYLGMGTPTFTASNPSCGYKVVGTLNYSWNLGESTVSVPLNATACFP